MRFIYPNLLWALLLVVVPIIIHFVNFQKHQTVFFSNINFLKLVRKETQRKSKLKQLLILTSRVLLLASLVLAFARPYFPNTQSVQKQTDEVIGIYIDNSFSMNGDGPEGKAIENARQKAYAIVNASNPNTKFVLLTNSLSEKENRFYTQTETKQLIAEVTENHRWTLMSNIVLRFKTITEKLLIQGQPSLYIISDFQKRSSDFENFKTDSTVTYNLVTVPISGAANLYIDSCWFDAPTHYANQLEVLSVRIINQSGQEYRQIPVNLFINDTLKALASANLNANEETTVVLQYTNPKEGILKGKVEITDYPIVHDNTIYLAYPIKNQLKTLLISDVDNSDAINNFKALFSNDELITLETKRADRLQINQLSENVVIFLNELKSISSGLIVELQKYVNNGGTLAIIPPANNQIASINQLLETFGSNTLTAADTSLIPLANVLYEHPLYKQVFKENSEKVALPNIKYRYRTNETSNKPHAQIVGYADQTKALSEVAIEKGKVYLFTFPLSHPQNEFLSHVLFMPTFYNIALYASPNQQLYHIMGKDVYFEWKGIYNSDNSEWMLHHDQSGLEYVPKLLPSDENSLKAKIENEFDAGWYTLNKGNQLSGAIALNYALDESDLSFYSNSEIETKLQQKGVENFNLIDAKSEEFAKAIEEIDNGKPYWKWLIAFALLLMLIEAAIIKFWK